MNHAFLCLLLAAVIPVQSASPEPKTIITVKSSPYCNALARHFNGAFVPMLANDRTLDAVNEDLIDINDLFGKPDYVSRFVNARTKLMKYVGDLQKSMPAIASEIGALREGAALSSDPQAEQQLRDSADDLQRAYTKQRAMSIDLYGMLQTMMDMDIDHLPHALGGNSYRDNQLPADMKDIKSFLRFDGQRDVIAQNEEKAVDTALDAATAHCSK